MTHPKIAVIGCGAIGTTLAYTLLLRHPHLEISLVNRNPQKAWAKAFDMSHCSPELPNRAIRAETPEECTGSDIIIMTAGALPRENGTRADVLKDNVAIFQTLLPTLARNNPNAVLINITNPVDAMAYAAGKITGYPPERVIGSGTELDSMRLRHFTAQALDLNAAELDIQVIGEHGDSMVPLWSLATYQGKSLTEAYPLLNEDLKATLLHQTKRAGWDIRLAGEHSCYGIAFSAVRIVEAILGESNQSVRVSAELQCEFGLPHSFISLPTTLNRTGIIQRHLPDISDAEYQLVMHSANLVQQQLDMVRQLL